MLLIVNLSHSMKVSYCFHWTLGKRVPQLLERWKCWQFQAGQMLTPSLWKAEPSVPVWRSVGQCFFQVVLRWVRLCLDQSWKPHFERAEDAVVPVFWWLPLQESTWRNNCLWVLQKLGLWNSGKTHKIPMDSPNTHTTHAHVHACSQKKVYALCRAPKLKIGVQNYWINAVSFVHLMRTTICCELPIYVFWINSGSWIRCWVLTFCSYDNKHRKERGYIMIFIVDKCTGFGHNW